MATVTIREACQRFAYVIASFPAGFVGRRCPVRCSMLYCSRVTTEPCPSTNGVRTWHQAKTRSIDLGVQACSEAGEWRAALSILDDLQLEGLKPDGRAYMAAMAACAKGGVVERSLALLERLLIEHSGDSEVLDVCGILEDVE